MRTLIAAVVCLGVLYVIDAHWFGGVYFTAIKGMIIQIRQSF